MRKIRTVLDLASLLVVASASFAGCGGDPPPTPKTGGEVKTDDKKSLADVKPADSAKAAPVSETSSNIHIDDAILKACGIEQANAFFAFDSANLRPEDAKPLDLVAKCFATGPLKGKLLKLVGHADPRGDGDYNFALGQARADSIAKYIMGKGLDKAQVSSTSRGAMDATGSDEPGWAKDRRVDLMLGA